MNYIEIQAWFNQNLPDLHIQVQKLGDKNGYPHLRLVTNFVISYEQQQVDMNERELFELLNGLEGSVLKAIGMLTIQGSIIGALLNEIRSKEDAVVSR